MANNQGFAAVVGSIERLRDSLIGDASRRAAYGRTRLSEQRRQTDELRAIRKSIESTNREERARKVTSAPKQSPKERPRDERGRYISARQAKAIAPARAMVPGDFANQLLAEWKVALGDIKQVTTQEMRALVADIRGQALRPIRPMERQRREKDLGSEKISIRSSFLTVTADRVAVSAKSKESQDKDNASLAKSLAGEIKNLKIQVDGGRNNPLGLVFQGLVAGIGFKIGSDISKGLQKGFKERTGFDAKTAGAGVGRFVGNPVRSSKETVSWRRKLELDNSLAMAEAQALEEEVNLKPGKPKVFTVGGTVGKKGKGGAYVKRALRNIGFKGADIETVENPYTDSDVDPVENQLAYQLSTYQKHVQSKIVRGYNPDAVNLAAKVIAALKKDKNADISLFGHSGGSDVVEEAIAILEKGGYTGVRGIGAGAMEMGVGFGTKGYKPLLGKKDMFTKAPVFAQLLEPTMDNFRGFSQVEGHTFDDYAAHPDFVKSVGREFQPIVVQKLLEQHYKEIIERSFNEFESALAELPKTPDFYPIALQLHQDFVGFLENSIKDAESFAGEFNQMFSEAENAPINEMLAQYEDVRKQIKSKGKGRRLKPNPDILPATEIQSDSHTANKQEDLQPEQAGDRQSVAIPIEQGRPRVRPVPQMPPPQ